MNLPIPPHIDPSWPVTRLMAETSTYLREIKRRIHLLERWLAAGLIATLVSLIATFGLGITHFGSLPDMLFWTVVSICIFGLYLGLDITFNRQIARLENLLLGFAWIKFGLKKITPGDIYFTNGDSLTLIWIEPGPFDTRTVYHFELATGKQLRLHLIDMLEDLDPIN